MKEITSKMDTKKINKILKEGGDITFRAGTYNLTAPLVLYSNTSVICEDGVIFNRKHSGRMMYTYATPKTTKYNGQHNINWYGGTFIADTHTGNANVITLFHAKDICLKDVTIRRCVGLHSIEVNACQLIDIMNCNISGQTSRKGEEFREAIQLDFANYDGLKWDGATGNSKCYDGTHCSEVLISDCTIDNCPVGIGTHTVSNTKKYHEGVNIQYNAIYNTPVEVRLCGFKDSVVTGSAIKNNSVKLVTKTEAHKFAGGKVKLDTPKGNKNIRLCRCNVEVV